MNENYEPPCIACKSIMFIIVIVLMAASYITGASVGRDVAYQEMGKKK